MKKDSIFGKNQKHNIRGRGKFIPKFSWRLRLYSWFLGRRIKKATESYKKEKMKFRFSA